MEGRLYLAPGDPKLGREAVSKGYVDRNTAQGLTRYVCAGCGLTVWGAPDIGIARIACDVAVSGSRILRRWESWLAIVPASGTSGP